MKGFFILGAGVMQIPAIKAAGRHYTVIAADGNDAAPGRKYADYFEHIDLKDGKELLEAVRRYDEKTGIAGIFTAGTDFSYMAAWLCEKMGLPGIKYETALNATVKTKMRSCFERSGVPSPKFYAAESEDDIDEIKEKISFPAVVKPVDNMGARGVVRIDKKEDLPEAFSNALRYSRASQVIVEEFMDGKEFSLDALVSRSEIKICGIADRHIFFPPYFVEMGHTMPSDVSEDILKEVSDVFRAGIKALGIDNGTAKGDIKYVPGRGAMVGEIAARLSGGYMSGWTYPYSTGFDVTGEALKIAAGEDLSESDPYFSSMPEYRGTSAERAFISIPGVVKSIRGYEHLEEDDKNIKNIFINIKPGDRVSFPENNVGKSGNIITFSKKRQDAVLSAEKGCAGILIALEPDESSTEEFLFGRKEAWIPDAFRLRCGENIALYKRMEDIFNSGSEAEGRIYIAALRNPDAELCRDWQQRTVSDAVGLLKKFNDIEFTGYPLSIHSPVLGKIFWKALFAGSVQGGQWIIDNFRSAGAENLKKRISKWKF